VESKGINYYPFSDVLASLADNLATPLVRMRVDRSSSYFLLDVSFPGMSLLLAGVLLAAPLPEARILGASPPKSSRSRGAFDQPL